MSVQSAGNRVRVNEGSFPYRTLVLWNVTGGDARLSRSFPYVMRLPGNVCVMLSHCARTRPGSVDLEAAGAVDRKSQDSV